MKFEVLRKETPYSGFFKIEEIRLRFEKFDGSMSTEVDRILLYKNEAVASILYLTDEEEIVLIRQFRMATTHVHGGWIIECVAGGIEEGENAEDAIRREVLEETGYRPADIEKISCFYVSPGITNERIHLYIAYSNSSQFDESFVSPDAEEDIERIHIPLADLREWLMSGTVVDAKTLIGLYEIQRRLGY